MHRLMKAVTALVITTLAVLGSSTMAWGQAAANGCPPGQPTGRPPGTPPANPGPPDGRPPSYPPGRCQLALSQSAGQRGDTFEATGNGFQPGERVALSMGGRELTSVIAGEDGSFVASLTVPRDAAIGQTQVRATAPSLTLEAAFEVLGSATTRGGAAASPSARAGSLSRTGADVEALVGLAAVLLTVGIVFVTIARRRRSLATPA